MKIAIDTNVLAYAEGIDDADKRAMATMVLRALPRSDIVIPVQVIGELYNVLLRKGRQDRTHARAAARRWSEIVTLFDTSSAVLLNALDLAATNRLNIWDSVILSAAAHAGCRLLLSEDLQDGFTWSGVTVANPFASPMHPLLRALLD